MTKKRRRAADDETFEFSDPWRALGITQADVEEFHSRFLAPMLVDDVLDAQQKMLADAFEKHVEDLRQLITRMQVTDRAIEWPQTLTFRLASSPGVERMRERRVLHDFIDAASRFIDAWPAEGASSRRERIETTAVVGWLQSRCEQPTKSACALAAMAFSLAPQAQSTTAFDQLVETWHKRKQRLQRGDSALKDR